MYLGNYSSNAWDYESLADSAIKEVSRQLRRQGGVGSVWVDEWKEWYQGDLGSLREFLESKPRFFRVVREGDRKYHVELVNHSGKGGCDHGGYGKGGGQGGFRTGPQSMGFGWGQGGGFWSKTTADAIKEIKVQLIDQGGTGKVWVDNWPRRFQPELGTLRQFLEARYDKFKVNPGKGSSFTVSLIGHNAEEGKASNYKGYKGDGKGYYQAQHQQYVKKPIGYPEKGGKRWKLKETDATAAAAAEDAAAAEEDVLEAEGEVEECERPSAFDDPIEDEDE